MENKYFLNEKRKRIEPLEKKCLYCDAEDFQNMEDNYFVPLFRENDRTNVIVYRSVKYNKVLIGIPRCPNCLNIHTSAENKAKLYSWATAAAVCFLSFCLWGPAGIFSIFVGVGIGFGGSYYLENKLVRQKDIFTKRDGAKRCDLVQDFILNGWSLNQPSA